MHKRFAGLTGLEVPQRSISEGEAINRIVHGKEAQAHLSGQFGLGPQHSGANAARDGQHCAPRRQNSKQKFPNNFSTFFKTKVPKTLFSPRLTILLMDATVWPSRDWHSNSKFLVVSKKMLCRYFW